MTRPVQLLSIAEAARRLGISRQAVRDRIQRGTLRTRKFPRGDRTLIRIPETALAAPPKKGGRPRKAPPKPLRTAA